VKQAESSPPLVLGRTQSFFYSCHIAPDSLLRPDGLANYLGHYFLIRCTVLQAPPAAVHCDAIPPFFIIYEPHALFGAFYRAAPENGFFIFSVKIPMLGSTLCAQHSAQKWYFEGALGSQVAIPLGE
jgi:hypothetical protein